MTVSDLPHFIKHEIEYENGDFIEWTFFLNISRDLHGKWSVGYVHYPDLDYLDPDGEPDREMVIPQLFFNSADSLNEIAMRMSKKIERFNRPNRIDRNETSSNS